MKIGIDLGGSHIGLGVINEENEIIECFEKDFSAEDKKDIKSIIENFIIETVLQLKEKLKIESIGIAIPGIAKNGIIIKTVNLGIDNYDIKTSLEKELNIPVTVKNDAKCACLAEYNNIVKEEPQLKSSNIVFLTIGTGIGGGVIYNGQLLEGHSFEGYELGHIVIKENGLPCKCGKSGCFERYGSILEFKNKVKQKLKIPQEINGNPLREIMTERRNEYKEIEEQYINDLALGISNLINIFEPDIVILGGGYAHFSYMFEENLKNKILNSKLLFNEREDIDIRTAKLGNNAGIIGATLV